VTTRERIDEVLRQLGLGDGDLLESLRDEGLFPDDEISPSEAEDLRVAVVLMREMGVNAAGVEVILRLRSRLVALQSRTEEALRLLLRER
jgi:hypothetical protein